MKRLRELQRRFQDYLTGVSEDIEKDIPGSTQALAEHRLATYYNAYRIRLIDLLAIDYSALEKHMGREAFENVVLDYLHFFPSIQPSARWVGQHMASYLRKNCGRDDHEFLAELAKFEWTQGLIFDAENESSLIRLEDIAELPAAAWPTMRIRFIPALQWLDLNWNVCPYSMALEAGNSPPSPQCKNLPARWLLWRKNYNPNWRSLDAHEAWAIEVAHQGTNFAELCEGLCEWITEDQVAVTAAGFLKHWIIDDLVVGIDY